MYVYIIINANIVVLLLIYYYKLLEQLVHIIGICNVKIMY